MSLRRLALQACDDAAALAVLGDAVIEHRWVDRRVCQLIDWDCSAKESRARHLAYAAAPTREWARACAAVLIFGGWTKGWYAWGWAPPPMTQRDMHAMMRRLWSVDAIRDQLARPSPILGLLARS